MENNYKDANFRLLTSIKCYIVEVIDWTSKYAVKNM